MSQSGALRRHASSFTCCVENRVTKAVTHGDVQTGERGPMRQFRRSCPIRTAGIDKPAIEVCCVRLSGDGFSGSGRSGRMLTTGPVMLAPW